LALANQEHIPHGQLPDWNAIVGLRNRIVHDYMNIDMDQVTAWVMADKDAFVCAFLLKDFSDPS
jgi:uncharacterized protein with HEPN domain